MPTLIEGIGRCEDYAFLPAFRSIQQRGHMAVIPQIIRTAPIEWDCSCRCQAEGFFAAILQYYLHDLHRSVCAGDPAGHSCPQLTSPVFPHSPMPQQPRFHYALLFRGRKFLRNLRGAHSCCRPQFAVFKSAPKISPRHAGTQILFTGRRQHKTVLVPLQVTL